jgi:multicomponent K+:H+ antiporter subunit F
MLGLALDFAFVALAGAFALAAFGLVIGPSVPDRILALDTLYVDAVAITILLGIRYDSLAYFEVALLVALIGFVSTAAFAWYAALGEPER